MKNVNAEAKEYYEIKKLRSKLRRTI